MKRLLAALILLPAVSAAQERPSVMLGTGLTEYCKTRGDPYCYEDQKRGLSIYQEFLDWMGQYSEGDEEWREASLILYHCDREYSPNALAFGGCLDGFLFDRR